MSRYREIVTLLKANTGARRLSEVFDDFVEMSALTLRNAADPIGHAEREEQYLLVAGKYSREQLDRFGVALGQVALAMQAEPYDVLGRLYMELELGNGNLGQFFTPFEVARLTAAVAGPPEDLAERVRARRFVTLCEPACGSGGLTIAAVLEIQNAGLDIHRDVHATLEDVSAQAVHMAYIHLALLGVPALVRHANTLTTEVFEIWPTPAHILGGWNARLTTSLASATAP